MILIKWKWQERMNIIPKSYYERWCAQNDSVVRVKKWVDENFRVNTQI